MKAFVFWWFLAVLALGQATPPTYPYPKPLPTSGTTPAATAKASGPVNTVAYGDNRAATWDVFFGGGFRSVGTTTERDQIVTGRRKQGMLVWVADDNHIYQLQTNLTSWVDLGHAGQYALGGTNIFNSDGTLTANRTLTGGGRDLTLTGIKDLTLLATNLFLANAPFMVLTSNTTNGFVQIQSNTSTTNYYIFPYLNLEASGDDSVVFRSKEGYVKHLPPITYEQITNAVNAGPTIYTGDGQLEDDRIIAGNAKQLSIVSVEDFSVTANDDIQFGVGDEGAILFSTTFFSHSTPVENAGSFIIHNGNTLTNRYHFTGYNTIASGTDAVMFRTVSDPSGGGDGQVRYDPTITHAGLLAAVAGGGVNIYNASGLLDEDREVDTAGFAFVLGANNLATAGQSQFIFGGTGNEIEGVNENAAILGGINNLIDDTVGGFNSAVILGGSDNYISNSDFGAILGGFGNVANEDYTRAHGFQAVAEHYGAEASASGGINGAGDAQKVEFQLRGQTSEGDPVVLTLDGLSLLPSIRDAGTTWLVDVNVVAKTSGTGSGKSAAFRRTFQIDRPGNELTTTLQGAVQSIGADSGSNAGSPPADWEIDIVADTTNSGFTLTFTGDSAADAIFVHANVVINQLVFP